MQLVVAPVKLKATWIQIGVMTWSQIHIIYMTQETSTAFHWYSVQAQPVAFLNEMTVNTEIM